MGSDAYIRIECEKCDEFIEVELTSLAGGGWDARNVTARIERNGWTYVDGEDFCKEHAAKISDPA